MTRFIYIADTHLGADPMGYQKQQGYPKRIAELLSGLSRYMEIEGNIDFILHGGDMLDQVNDSDIIRAITRFKLPVPLYLCLGNHDLTTPGAVEKWLQLAPELFLNNKPYYSIELPDCVIHVVPNHWQNQEFYWRDQQNAHFSDEQKVWLDRQLEKRTNLPHLILTHSPVFGLPPRQTGLEQPYHAPAPDFTRFMTELAARHNSLKCVLGAHNHMNMRVTHENVEYITVSAMVETPFECKLFEVKPDQLSMSTISLEPWVSLTGVYNPDNAYVQGHTIDRSFQNRLAGKTTSQGRQLVNPDKSVTAPKGSILKRFIFPRYHKRFLLRVLMIAITAFLFFQYILAPAWVAGASMEPTYTDGSFLFYLPWLGQLRPPQTGDVVMIKMAGRRIMLMKRVVAMPGEIVEFRNGWLYINGYRKEEPYVVFRHNWELPPRIVRPGHVYLVGDNRGMPMHQHDFGQTPISRIAGYAAW